MFHDNYEPDDDDLYNYEPPAPAPAPAPAQNVWLPIAEELCRIVQRCSSLKEVERDAAKAGVLDILMQVMAERCESGIPRELLGECDHCGRPRFASDPPTAFHFFRANRTVPGSLAPATKRGEMPATLRMANLVDPLEICRDCVAAVRANAEYRRCFERLGYAEEVAEAAAAADTEIEAPSAREMFHALIADMKYPLLAVRRPGHCLDILLPFVIAKLDVECDAQFLHFCEGLFFDF